MRFILEERLGWVGLQGEGEGRFGCKGTVHFHPLFTVYLTPRLLTTAANEYRQLEDPPQRLALRPRHADRAPRRLDQILVSFASFDGRLGAREQF